jgi:hypothetical protein
MGRVRLGRAKFRTSGLAAVAALLSAATAMTGIGSLQAASAGAAVATAQTPHASGSSLETNSAYAIVDAAGGVMTFGGAGYSGDTLAVTLHEPIVGSAPDPTGGYWLVASDGGVFTFGGAQFYGSTGDIILNKPIVGMAATPDGGGYWLVASDGGIFAFGDAQFWGSTGDIDLNQPIVGMAATPDGGGYWLVASDGGVFAFGDANFWGSTGDIHLNKPIVGMAATHDGGGYWLVASDGGIFAFGDAPFYGSTGGITLNAPIVGMAATPDGGGYWLVGNDAGVFTFGDGNFSGSAESPLHPPYFPAGFSAPIPPVVAIMPDVPGPQATHQGPLRVAFVGDSLAFYEGEYTLKENPPYLLDNGAAPGCGINNGATLIPWSNPASIYTDPAACVLWAQQLQWVTSRFHPDVAVLQAGYWECQDRLFDGQYVTLANQGYADYIEADLEQAVNILHSDGAQVLLATAPDYNDGTPASLVSAYNQLVEAVASQYPSFVTVFDTYGLLDPNGAYSTVVDGVVARTPDGVHLTQAGVNDIIDGPLNSDISSVGQPVYNGTS